MKLLKVQAFKKLQFLQRGAICVINCCHKLCASISSPKIRCHHLVLKRDAWKYGSIPVLWFGLPVFLATRDSTCHKRSISQMELLCELKSLNAYTMEWTPGIHRTGNILVNNKCWTWWQMPKVPKSVKKQNFTKNVLVQILQIVCAVD